MPDTFAYYVAGYVVAGLVYVGYVLSLVVRARRIPTTIHRPPSPDA